MVSDGHAPKNTHKPHNCHHGSTKTPERLPLRGASRPSHGLGIPVKLGRGRIKPMLRSGKAVSKPEPRPRGLPKALQRKAKQPEHASTSGGNHQDCDADMGNSVRVWLKAPMRLARRHKRPIATHPYTSQSWAARRAAGSRQRGEGDTKNRLGANPCAPAFLLRQNARCHCTIGRITRGFTPPTLGRMQAMVMPCSALVGVALAGFLRRHLDGPYPHMAGRGLRVEACAGRHQMD